jgi:pimeloyl-ACP methyl ester carboxylesterase
VREECGGYRQSMLKGRRRVVLAATTVMAFGLGALADRGLRRLRAQVSKEQNAFQWPDGFSTVEIQSSIDHTRQKAIFRAAPPGAKRPLLVSLHVWAGDFASRDSLAPLAFAAAWNYIHPDFRGPNRGTDNCLSEKVVADIDDAIAYSVQEGNVDPDNIFVVGFSGGAYAALGMYVRSRHSVRAYLAWAPIADLFAWHEESAARGNVELAQQIRDCTGSGERLVREDAQRRSPLSWTLASVPKSRIELFAGIDDGYSGTVPISHSIRFFNRLTELYGVSSRQVTSDEIVVLLSRGVAPKLAAPHLEGRTILFHRDVRFASLTVFQGSHEMPPDFCFARLQSLVRRDTPPQDYKSWD